MLSSVDVINVRLLIGVLLKVFFLNLSDGFIWVFSLMTASTTCLNMFLDLILRIIVNNYQMQVQKLLHLLWNNNNNNGLTWT